MNANDMLAVSEDAARTVLARIGNQIGYGNAQHILGELWDAMLTRDYGIENPGRGRMGVTVDDALPPIPRATSLRRQMQPHGGYEMVPAYTVAELKSFAHAAIDKALAAKETQ